MKRINIRESLIQMDRNTSCKYDLTTMYESVSLTEEKKKELVKYIDAYDIDATNKFLGNEVSSQGLTEFYDDDFSDEEIASIMGGDTKNDNPDGLETPQETEKRLQENTDRTDLETEIKTEVEHFMSELGFDSIDTEEATFIEVNEVGNNTLKITVEAEVYDDIKKLARRLNNIVKKYDAKSRFKSVDSCIIEAYVRLNPSVNEDIDATNDTYTFISSKSVPDSDGFQTDYTWYKASDGTNVFVFGDNDIYKPEDGYFDHVEEDDGTAQEWFDSYHGLIEGDDMWEKLQSLEELTDLKSANDDMEDKVLDESVDFNLEEIKAVVGGKVSDYLHNELGYGNDFINDYVFVEVTPSDNDTVKVEVRAELSYEELSNLGEVLNNIISTYDSNAYFEPETAGILVAYIGNEDDKGEIDYDTVDKVSDKLNATKSFDELKQVYETEIVPNRDNWSRSTLDAIYTVVDELIDTYENNESIDENLCESNNVQFGVHQFSTNSIIFRGTEEECGKYIDKHKELWDDAEVYMMTPNDPHYKRTYESLNEGILNPNRLVQWAVGILFDMDRFVMDVYDNQGWLMNGVPDGEFEETTPDEAMQNYTEHDWLVTDIDTNDFSVEDFTDFLNTFKSATSNKRDYDQVERQNIISEAEDLLDTVKMSNKESVDESKSIKEDLSLEKIDLLFKELNILRNKYSYTEYKDNIFGDSKKVKQPVVYKNTTKNGRNIKYVFNGYNRNCSEDFANDVRALIDSLDLSSIITVEEWSARSYTGPHNDVKINIDESKLTKTNESKSIKESSLVDKKVSTLGKRGKPMYFTAAQLKDAKAKYPEYDFEEATIDKSLPRGQKAYIAKKKTNESKSIKEDYSDEVVTLSRYLDVEVPDICSGVLDLIEHLPSHKISYATKICRDFYAKMESIIRHYTMTGDNFDVSEDFYPNEGGTPKYAQYKYDTEHKEPRTFPLDKFGTEEDIDDLRNNTDYYVNRYDIKLNFTDSTFTVSGPDSDRFIRDYKLDECISENSSNDDVGCE